MTTLVVDIEANGFYDTVTKIHCIVTKDVETGRITKCWEQAKHDNSCIISRKSIEVGLSLLQDADKIVGHNFIDYDMRVIEKLYGVKLDVDKIVDTYLLSQMLDPHRRKWKQSKKGAHSLENWGYIVGRGKPDHDDWEEFTSEMLHRCVEDVEITELVAKQLGVL